MGGRAVIPVLGALTIVSSGASAQVVAPSDSSQVAATATVERMVAPDRAVLFIEVAGGGPSGDIATLEVTDARDRVLAALETAGVDGSAVSPWGFAAGEAAPGRGPMGRPDGSTDASEARAGLRVVTTPDRVDALAQAASSAGGSVLTVAYEAADTEALYDDLLREAVRRARTRAEAMAEASGGRLGRLVQLSTMPDYEGIAWRERLFQVGFRGQGVHIVPSNVAVRTTVQAAWLWIEG